MRVAVDLDRGRVAGEVLGGDQRRRRAHGRIRRDVGVVLGEGLAADDHVGAVLVALRGALATARRDGPDDATRDEYADDDEHDGERSDRGPAVARGAPLPGSA